MNKSAHRFFCPNIESGSLDEEESGHALRVLRLKAGDSIQLVDGKGSCALAQITDESKRGLRFSVSEIRKSEISIPDLHIAIAPTKNIDRFEFFLEKSCETGIRRITPLKCRNSERKEIKHEKLQKNLLSAMKQSGQLYLPELSQMTDFREFIKSIGSEYDQKFIAHCEDDTEKKFLHSVVEPSKKTIILIGPEGDFTAEEINLAKETGFVPVSLGNSRLRTETAGIVACITVQLKELH